MIRGVSKTFLANNSEQGMPFLELEFSFNKVSSLGGFFYL